MFCTFVSDLEFMHRNNGSNAVVKVWLGFSPVTLLKMSGVVDTKLLNVPTFPLNRLSQSRLDYLQMFGVVYSKTQAVIAYSTSCFNKH